MSNSTKEVLTAEQEAVKLITDNLFSVQKVGLHPNVEGLESPLAYGIYKTEGGSALGVVGKDYTPPSSTLLFEGLVDALIDIDSSLESLKLSYYKGERKFRFIQPIRTVTFTNAKGVAEETTLFLNLESGYDGQTKSGMYVTSERKIQVGESTVTYTTRIYGHNFSLAYKNTPGNIGKVTSMTADVVRMIESSEEIEELILKFDSYEVSDYQIKNFIKRVFGMERKDYLSWGKRKQNIFDGINQTVGMELERSGKTAYGLLNAVANWTNQSAKVGSEEDYLLVDTGRYYNDLAQKFLISTVK